MPSPSDRLGGPDPRAFASRVLDGWPRFLRQLEGRGASPGWPPSRHRARCLDTGSGPLRPYTCASKAFLRVGVRGGRPHSLQIREQRWAAGAGAPQPARGRRSLDGCAPVCRATSRRAWRGDAPGPAACRLPPGNGRQPEARTCPGPEPAGSEPPSPSSGPFCEAPSPAQGCGHEKARGALQPSNLCWNRTHNAMVSIRHRDCI